MAPGLKAGPVTRVCHVCGRQYGLSSFDIHLKQCKKLWIAQEEQKPVNERRPIPKTPPGLGGVGLDGGEPMSRDEVEALNRVAQEAFNTHGMEKCENCGRTFAEGRLAIHNKSCRPDSVAKKVADGAAPRNRPGMGHVEISMYDAASFLTSRSCVSNQATEVEYGRARNRSNGSEDSSSKRNVGTPPPNQALSDPQTPPATAGASRPLTGSLASNRKRIAGKETTSTGTSRQSIQSPLSDSILAAADAEEVCEKFKGKEDVVRAIEARLSHWEATTVATLQEIRDLKALFSQIK